MVRMQETLNALNERLEIIDRRQLSMNQARRKVAHDGEEGEEDTDAPTPTGDAASQDGDRGSKTYL